MLVVVGSRHDRTLAPLLRDWAGRGGVLLSCEDLSTAGWRFEVDDPGASTAVIGGVATPAAGIAGVLIRRPCVFEAELVHIRPAHRAYVAAEMNAFLFAWLASLTCPVLNRPSPLCLLGSSWSAEQWLRAAEAVGVSTRFARRGLGAAASEARPGLQEAEVARVTVVGRQCFGAISAELADKTRALAELAGADLLGVTFLAQGDEFLGADLKPDLSAPEIGEAVLHYFLGGGSRP